jgi:hypothetical protein
MECKNHPGVEATARCAGCQETFCSNCMVQIQGQNYCGACKVMALKGGTPVVEEATIPCKEAKESLIYAIVGILICGIILGPVAISKALAAKKLIAANPRLTGSGQVTAALIIGIVVTVLNVIAIIAKFTVMK